MPKPSCFATKARVALRTCGSAAGGRTAKGHASASTSTAIAAKGLRKSAKDKWKDLSYMEARMRASIGGAKQRLMRSSGLEDYFLGTYYFNKGRYATPVAGLTHFNAAENEFSAYRFHEDDPVFFQNGLRLTCRCGERIGDKVFHDPPATRYTTCLRPDDYQAQASCSRRHGDLPLCA